MEEAKRTLKIRLALTQSMSWGRWHPLQRAKTLGRSPLRPHTCLRKLAWKSLDTIEAGPIKRVRATSGATLLSTKCVRDHVGAAAVCPASEPWPPCLGPGPTRGIDPGNHESRPPAQWQCILEQCPVRHGRGAEGSAGSLRRPKRTMADGFLAAPRCGTPAISMRGSGPCAASAHWPPAQDQREARRGITPATHPVSEIVPDTFLGKTPFSRGRLGG